MPSIEHEFPIELFRNRPALAPGLLSDAFGVDIPDHTEIREENCTFTDIAPTEYRVDHVVSLRNDHPEIPEMAIIVEIQRAADDRKRLSWPVYISTLRARLRCDTLLMVFCPTEKTAAWSAEPITLGHPGLILRPLVIGPSQVPVVTDPQQARESPELAALSALAHGEDRKVLQAFAEALKVVDEDEMTFGLYHDYVTNNLSKLAWKQWEALMATGTYEYKTEFARKYVAIGRKEGEAKGEARSILAVLSARDIPVSEGARERITSCTDLDQLELWVRRAATVTSADELFD